MGDYPAESRQNVERSYLMKWKMILKLLRSNLDVMVRCTEGSNIC